MNEPSHKDTREGTTYCTLEEYDEGSRGDHVYGASSSADHHPSEALAGERADAEGEATAARDARLREALLSWTDVRSALRDTVLFDLERSAQTATLDATRFETVVVRSIRTGQQGYYERRAKDCRDRAEAYRAAVSALQKISDEIAR